MNQGSDPSSQLSDEEAALLLAVAHGHAAQRIARSLALSEATLRRRLRKVQKKLGANSRINAVYLAAKRGVI